MRRGTNLPAVGSFNQSVVLDLIRRVRRGMSRVEIAERTGLALQTVSNASRRLIDDGMVVEGEKQITGPGKPRVILQLEPSSRYAVGVHLDPTIITYLLLDLRGDIVAHKQVRTAPAATPSEILAQIASTIDDLIDTADVGRDKLLGIGIAAPGPIDSARGVIVDPPLLEGWKVLPKFLPAADTSRLSTPTLIRTRKRSCLQSHSLFARSSGSHWPQACSCSPMQDGSAGSGAAGSSRHRASIRPCGPPGR